jgi:hypothetical protein
VLKLPVISLIVVELLVSELFNGGCPTLTFFFVTLQLGSIQFRIIFNFPNSPGEARELTAPEMKIGNTSAI